MAVLTLLALGSSLAHAGAVSILPNRVLRTVEVETMKELKFRGAVRQQYDFSCGAAAVATLLTYHFEDATDEPQVFKHMWAHGDRKKIQKEGFSFLDMRNYLHDHGYEAEGFREPIEQLFKARIPFIALVKINGYSHFVVVKGMSEKDILVGDPALGVRVMTRAEFEQIRDPIVLAVRNKLRVARKNFNLEQDWAVRPKPPIRVAFDNRGLGTFAMMMPAFNEF